VAYRRVGVNSRPKIDSYAQPDSDGKVALRHDQALRSHRRGGEALAPPKAASARRSDDRSENDSVSGTSAKQNPPGRNLPRRCFPPFVQRVAHQQAAHCRWSAEGGERDPK